MVSGHTVISATDVSRRNIKAKNGVRAWYPCSSSDGQKDRRRKVCQSHSCDLLTSPRMETLGSVHPLLPTREPQPVSHHLETGLFCSCQRLVLKTVEWHRVNISISGHCQWLFKQKVLAFLLLKWLIENMETDCDSSSFFPQHNYLAQVTSNIWGTKFKIVGLAAFLPTNLGAGKCCTIGTQESIQPPVVYSELLQHRKMSLYFPPKFDSSHHDLVKNRIIVQFFFFFFFFLPVVLSFFYISPGW